MTGPWNWQEIGLLIFSPLAMAGLIWLLFNVDKHLAVLRKEKISPETEYYQKQVERFTDVAPGEKILPKTCGVCEGGIYRHGSALFEYYSCGHAWQRPLNNEDVGQWVFYPSPYKTEAKK